jgi:hypothetical protein
VWWSAVILVLVGASVVWWWTNFGDPPAAWVVRWRIDRYLKQQTGKSEFPTDFEYPSQALMAQTGKAKPEAPSGPLVAGPTTKKDFAALCNAYIPLAKDGIILRREIDSARQAIQENRTQADAAGATNATVFQERVTALEKDIAARQELLAKKDEALAPILSDLWAIQGSRQAHREAQEAATGNAVSAEWNRVAQEIRRQLNEASSWSAMYEPIGQEIEVSRRLFESANPAHQRLALSIALRASRDALNEAQNGWLAARLCEGYVLSHLDLASDTDRRSPFSLENVMNECVNLFRRAGETGGVIRGYRLVLARANSPQRADWARAQLAQVLEQTGDYAEALRCLQQIRATNDFRWALNRVPRLQQRLSYSQ